MPLADHQLTLEHEKLLWDTKELDLNSSKGLVQAVIFYLIKCFAIWQGKELRQLQTNHISFGEDKLGKFVTLDLESSVFKRKRCVKRYDDPANPRSVYKILKKYRSRIPNEGPFIVRPISSIKDFICYSPLPLGVKFIKSFISNLMEDAGIGQCFANYSLNLHSIDTLMRFGTGYHCLSSWLVKNSIESFPTSPECSITNCEDLNPEVSVMVSRLLDAPYPFDAVEILQEMEHEEEKQSKEKDNVLPPNFDSWMTNLMKNSSAKNGQKDNQILENGRMIHSDVKKTENKSLSCCGSVCKINVLSSDMNGDLSPKDGKAPQKDSCTSKVGSDKSSPRIMTVSSITEGAFSLQVDEGDHILEKEVIDRNDESMLPSFVCGERKGENEKSQIDFLASKRRKNVPLNWERKEENEKSEMDSLATKKRKNDTSDHEKRKESEKSEMYSLALKKQKNVYFDSEDNSEEIISKKGELNNCNKTTSYLKTMLETNVSKKEINERSRNTLTVNKEQMELESDKEMNKTKRCVSEIGDVKKETVDEDVHNIHLMQVDAPLQGNNLTPLSHKLGEEKAQKVTKEHQSTMKNCSYKLPNPDTSHDSITILRMLLRNPSDVEKTSIDEEAAENGEFDRNKYNENLTDQSTENMIESDNHMTNILQTEKSETIAMCENESASRFDEDNDTNMQLLMDLDPPTLSPQPPTSVQEKGDGSADPKSLTCSVDLNESLSSQCAPNLVSADILQFLDKANQQMKNILNASVTENDSHKVNSEKSSIPTSSQQSEQSSTSSIKILSTHSRKSKKRIKVTSTSPVDEPSPGKINIARESDTNPKSAKVSEQSQSQFPLLRLFLEQPTRDTDLTSDSLSPCSIALKSKQMSHKNVSANSPTNSDARKDSNELPELTFMGHTCTSSDNHDNNEKLFQSKLETSKVTKNHTGCISLSEDSECPLLVSSLSSSPSMPSLPASPCAALNTCTSDTAEYHVEKDLVNNAVYQSLLVNYEKDGGIRTFTFADIPIVSDSSSLSKRVKATKQTSEINLGDYFPPGTLIPAKDIHLVTQQGPDGCDIVMKFKFSSKI